MRDGFAQGTCDPLYERLWKNYTAGRNLELGDANNVAMVIADACEAENPKARYLVGKDAEEIAALSSEDFEREIIEKMTLPK